MIKQESHGSCCWAWRWPSKKWIQHQPRPTLSESSLRISANYLWRMALTALKHAIALRTGLSNWFLWANGGCMSHDMLRTGWMTWVPCTVRMPHIWEYTFMEQKNALKRMLKTFRSWELLSWELLQDIIHCPAKESLEGMFFHFHKQQIKIITYLYLLGSNRDA